MTTSLICDPNPSRRQPPRPLPEHPVPRLTSEQRARFEAFWREKPAIVGKGRVAPRVRP